MLPRHELVDRYHPPSRHYPQDPYARGPSPTKPIAHAARRHERQISHDSNGYEARERYPPSYEWAGRGGRGESSRIVRDVVLPPNLQGSEDVWEEALRKYQVAREREANELAAYAQALVKDEIEAAVAAAKADASASKVTAKRKGWPADHPTRIAQREAREAAIAAGEIVPKRKARKPVKKKEDKAALEDELLGLAEGDNASVSRSSLPPEDGSDDEHDGLPRMGWSSTDIVQPCGLTREEVISKVEAGDMSGLTEADVKAVQDEMWMRQKDASGLARKDGTIRKKPGPAKGWKKLRGDNGSVRGDNDSDAGTSIAGDTVNGEADAEINALLGDDDSERRLDDDDASDDEKADASTNDPSSKKKSGKNKQPGVGKGNWTRPPKEDKELVRKAEALAVQNHIQAQDNGVDGDHGVPTDINYEVVNANPDLLTNMAAPNTEDPRGVSETEAKIRFGLVEELQRQTWASICRDIPRMYRVYQTADTVLKQDCARTASAVIRNGFAQRSAKPTFRSTARINKDATSKAKKVIKEMLLYWRKNEKDELAARKKAEKEAMERAKAEEEAREAKRQSRKLNFLLTQTELYSHFIGKKIKTKEAEGADGEEIEGADPAAANEELGLNADGEPLPDIDYDDGESD